MKPKFIISGGGTGGHIYPAIAIANELKTRFQDAEFLFVGAKDRMEMTKVPQAGYKIEGLWISGLQRKLSLKNLTFPLKLIHSLIKSRQIIKKFNPDVVIGTGGYASAPLLKAASNKNIPCVIQEQNSVAGITNKWLAKNVAKICVAYEGMEKYFPKSKIRLTGNPVRQDLIQINISKEVARKKLELSHEKMTLLVLGGSLGAKAINALIASHLEFFEKQQLQLLWQCGSFYYETYKKHHSKTVKVVPYIDEMNTAYAASDVIISRAGALSVSELCLVGKPVIFIPSPNVAEDHQTHNAKAIAEKNAAVLIKENELNTVFKDKFLSLIASKEKREELSVNIKKMAKPNATKEIVNEIVALMNIK